jgi:hypothetical protein
MARTLRLAILTGVLAALVVGTGTVLADHGSDSKLIQSGMAGLPSTFVGKPLAGVNGAGHAWAIDEGSAKLTSDGQLILNVEGLVLSPEGNNPVTSGRAIVSCNGGANIILSAPVPFDAAGDAHVKAHLTLPSQCLAPTIFFGNGTGTAWFAVSG